MDLYATYNTPRAYKVNHKLILSLAESLSDEQLPGSQLAITTPLGLTSGILHAGQIT